MNIRFPGTSSEMPMPSIRWVNTISGASAVVSTDARLTVLPRGGSPRIRPVHNAMSKIEFQIDRLRQVVEPDFDVAAVCRRLALWNLDIRAEDAAEPSVVRTFLRPVHLLARGIDR